MAKVMTHYAHPPIPTRTSDWCAWFDGQEEGGPYGWGRTEAEAIEDLYIVTDTPMPDECPMCWGSIDEDARYCAHCGDFV